MLWLAIKATFLSFGLSSPDTVNPKLLATSAPLSVPGLFGVTGEQGAYAVCFSFTYAEIV